jgi:hypothetical protein
MTVMNEPFDLDSYKDPKVIWDSNQYGTATRLSRKGDRPAVYMHDPLLPVYPNMNRARRRQQDQFRARILRKLRKNALRNKRRTTVVG